MTPPLPATLAPMEAESVAALPEGDAWQYEPKWDGFRCLAFRDGQDVLLQSKSGQPLARYFPDVVAALRALGAPRFVLDGEIVVPVDGVLSFDDLLQRIHPAASRVKLLAAQTPAVFIAFDLLADEAGRPLVPEPLSARRAALEAFAERYLDPSADAPVRLSPCTREVRVARGWLDDGRAGLDGVVAKRVDLPYRAGERDGMRKVKRLRTGECVVGGFRYASSGRVVGSLLLGLHDAAGLLHHVGFTSSFTAPQRAAITPKVEALKGGTGFTGKAPGGPSRWSTKRSAEWEALRPELVVEVGYDHFSAGRFRHGTTFRRWRPDKAPRQCTLAQVEREGANALVLLGAA